MPAEPGLTAGQHHAREQSLTQSHAARLRVQTSAVVLKCDDTFLVADVGGDVGGADGCGLGLFYRDTRFLSRYQLTLNDHPLRALSSEHGGGDWATHALENDALEALRGANPGEPHTIAVRRCRTAGDGAIRELIAITNFGSAAARLCLQLHFAADFRDLFRVRNISEHEPGDSQPTQLSGGNCARLLSVGQDGLHRSTTLLFSPRPSRLAAGCAVFELQFDSHQTRKIDIEITLAVSGGSEPADCAPGVRHHRARPADPRALERGTPPHGQELVDTATQVDSRPLLDKIIRRSLLDLSLLRCRSAQDLHYIAGGVPWFVTLFGRDSALCALQLCAFRPEIAGDTARLLARYQATHEDAYRDAEPGKILHELRDGQLAHLGVIPQSPAYYGSVDSTLLFLIVLAEYVNWSGNIAIVGELRPHIDAALAWIERYSDSDGDGYIDYGGRHNSGSYRNGLVNQGWKDSGDAIVNADGSLATPPIALCEVQGYLYRAWHSAAALLRIAGDASGAARLEHDASALSERFERDFWSDELGCYLLARQQHGRPVTVVTSNAGQVLWSGISSPQHAAAVVRRMMAADMFSGWGVRTLSTNEVRYNPLSYHLGSVWPHDNSLLCAGFRRYGHDREAVRIFDALYAAASGIRDHRMPELYCGFERSAEESRPIPYPVACSPQAWAAGSIPYALTALLGLQADAVHDRLRIIDPCLPEWLDLLQLKRVQVGAARVDLRFERSREGRIDVQAVVQEGTLEVQSQSRH